MSKPSKYRDCIVSADEFDGDTGIETLIDRYNAENNTCQLTSKDRIDMMRSEGKLKDADFTITKKCGHCGRILPLSHFSKSSRQSLGVNYMCRECDSTYRRINRLNRLLR